MFAPGIVGLVMGVVILLAVRDSPEAVGFPPVEVVKAAPAAPSEPATPKESRVDRLVNDVLM